MAPASISEYTETSLANRGILALLRTRPDRFTQQQSMKRDAFFAEHPAIEAIYQFQKQLHQLLMNKARNKDWRRDTIPDLMEMINALKKVLLKRSQLLVKPSFNGEVRMWRFTKSNGITEGFHRKMKLIQSRTFHLFVWCPGPESNLNVTY